MTCEKIFQLEAGSVTCHSNVNERTVKNIDAKCNQTHNQKQSSKHNQKQLSK